MSRATRPAAGGRGGRRKGITAAGRKRLSEMMKARWAARRKKGAARAKVAGARGRRSRLTAAGRRRLSEMMKARWAAKRKSAKAA